ncbi:hypothetical protein Asp14428_48500 [Actinoplanes sp. NBRC 14428]|nr:hypothetical protein Asp14428_48500 [Actinoplanes sp. NBRC 14428]
MPSNDFGRDLSALAAHGERTGHLSPAAAIRARADRRRRNRQVATGALAFLVVGGIGVGIAVNQQPRKAAPPAVTPTAPAPSVTNTPPAPVPSTPSSPPSRPPSNSTPTSTPPTSKPTSKPPRTVTGNVFAGDREVLLLPENSEATVALDGNERATLSDNFGDRALFVLNEVSGGRYWIQTARIRSGGEALCLQAGETSGAAAPVTAEGCDAAAQRQLWRFRKVGETSDGKPKYTIRTAGDYYLVQDPDGTLSGGGGTGIVAAYIGEGTPDIDTPFVLPDRGEASQPSLD